MPSGSCARVRVHLRDINRFIWCDCAIVYAGDARVSAFAGVETLTFLWCFNRQIHEHYYRILVRIVISYILRLDSLLIAALLSSFLSFSLSRCSSSPLSRPSVCSLTRYNAPANAINTENLLHVCRRLFTIIFIIYNHHGS